MDNGKPIGKCYKCGADLYATLGLCLSCENEQLQAENKRLTQYKDYVESRINENTLPKPYGEWNKVVEDLAKELHHKKSRPVSGKN